MRTLLITLIIAATASIADADERPMTPMRRTARPSAWVPPSSRAGDFPDLPINLHEVSTPLKNGKVRIGSRGGTDFLIDSKGYPLSGRLTNVKRLGDSRFAVFKEDGSTGIGVVDLKTGKHLPTSDAAQPGERSFHTQLVRTGPGAFQYDVRVHLTGENGKTRVFDRATGAPVEK